ncbi:MAG: hypothetical protein NVS3B16_20020 [Vulcanimicrobiaceae bacterium]
MLSATFLASCSGGGGGGTTPPPPIGPPPVVTQSYTFPAGDAKASSGIAWDIIGVKTTLSSAPNNGTANAYDTLRVDVTFVQDVSNALPAPGSALNTGSQVGVSISIDSDGNSLTGFSGPCDASSRLKPFEFQTDQGNAPSRLSDGNYTILSNGAPVYSGVSNPLAEEVVAVSQSTLSYTFNLATLGVFSGRQVPRIGIAVSAFNGNSRTGTDCVPTANSGLTEVYTTAS